MTITTFDWLMANYNPILSIPDTLIHEIPTKTIENNKMFKNVNAALVSQIRYQIDTALRRAKAEGHVSNYSMSALEALFEVYKAMGGNGFVESEMEEIRKINQNGGN